MKERERGWKSGGVALIPPRSTSYLPCGLGPLTTGEFRAAREAATVFPAAHCGPASRGALWDISRPGGRWSCPGPQQPDPGEASSVVGLLWPGAKLWPSCRCCSCLACFHPLLTLQTWRGFVSGPSWVLGTWAMLVFLAKMEP